MAETMQGTVKWFDAAKGYGFVTPALGGKDIFIHFTGINGKGYRSLEDGTKVNFEVETTDRGPKAVNVTPV